MASETPAIVEWNELGYERRWVEWPDGPGIQWRKVGELDWKKGDPDPDDYAQLGRALAMRRPVSSPKYRVRRTDGRDVVGEKHDGCPLLTLDLRHDSDARVVAVEYATRAMFSPDPDRRAFASELSLTLINLGREEDAPESPVLVARWP